MTVPMMFSTDETCDIGMATGTPVSPDFQARRNEFSGKVKWVQLDLGKENDDHLVTVGDLYRIAMARQ